jgi:hypothetical protein
MRSFLALLAIFAFLIVVAVQSAQEDPSAPREKVPDYSLTDLQAIAEREEKLEGQRCQGNEFRRVLHDVLARLMTEELSLGEAADLMLARADLNPAWEKGLQRTEPAHLSRRGRVASNLLRHYEIALEFGSLSADRRAHLDALRRELATWDTNTQSAQPNAYLQ